MRANIRGALKLARSINSSGFSGALFRHTSVPSHHPLLLGLIVIILTVAGVSVAGESAGSAGDVSGPAFEGSQSPSFSSGRSLSLSIHEGGLSYIISSKGQTVGEALAAAGVRFGPHDLVSPGPGTRLTAGVHIFIRRALAIELVIGDEREIVFSRAGTIRELLTEKGITLNPLDRLNLGLDTPTREGLAVSLTLVKDEIIMEKTLIAREVIYLKDPGLASGKSYVLQWGSDGAISRQYKITYENGQEIERMLLSEERTDSEKKVVAVGTYQSATVASGGGCEGVNFSKAMSVYATWYNAVSAGSSTTATGAFLDYGIIAVDPHVIPLGTKICVPGYGIGIAADTGGGIFGNRIDLGYPGSVFGWAPGYIEIYILN